MSHMARVPISLIGSEKSSRVFSERLVAKGGCCNEGRPVRRGYLELHSNVRVLPPPGFPHEDTMARRKLEMRFLFDLAHFLGRRGLGRGRLLVTRQKTAQDGNRERRAHVSFALRGPRAGERFERPECSRLCSTRAAALLDRTRRIPWRVP